MRAYSVFDDVPLEAAAVLGRVDVEATLHPYGVPRPSGETLRELIEAYDIVLISTAETVTEDMLRGVKTPKILATASSGTDHIHIPADKAALIRVANAPTANAQSVAEHTFALLLALEKHLTEARVLAAHGESKKKMRARPEELAGQTLGVIGAGHTAAAVLRLGKAFDMETVCWTRYPERHADIVELGVRFAALDELLTKADVISLNLPLTEETQGLISRRRIDVMKPGAAFVSTSRPELIDLPPLLGRAAREPDFAVGLDIDAGMAYGLWNEASPNVIVTPHIAGGTTQARRRLFLEVCTCIADLVAEDVSER